MNTVTPTTTARNLASAAALVAKLPSSIQPSADKYLQSLSTHGEKRYQRGHDMVETFGASLAGIPNAAKARIFDQLIARHGYMTRSFVHWFNGKRQAADVQKVADLSAMMTSPSNSLDWFSEYLPAVRTRNNVAVGLANAFVWGALLLVLFVHPDFEAVVLSISTAFVLASVSLSFTRDLSRLWWDLFLAFVSAAAIGLDAAVHYRWF